MKNNSLSSTNLYLGQILKIEKTQEEIETKESCYGDVNEINESQDKTEYIVQKGDSLYSISQKFNTNITEIIKENNLETTMISIGQKLIIPITNNNDNQVIYIVQKNDNLYSIANKFKTSIEKIKNSNNLTSNLLSIGQKLIIERTI